MRGGSWGDAVNQDKVDLIPIQFINVRFYPNRSRAMALNISMVESSFARYSLRRCPISSSLSARLASRLAVDLERAAILPRKRTRRSRCGRQQVSLQLIRSRTYASWKEDPPPMSVDSGNSTCPPPFLASSKSRLAALRCLLLSILASLPVARGLSSSSRSRASRRSAFR